MCFTFRPVIAPGDFFFLPTPDADTARESEISSSSSAIAASSSGTGVPASADFLTRFVLGAVFFNAAFFGGVALAGVADRLRLATAAGEALLRLLVVFARTRLSSDELSASELDDDSDSNASSDADELLLALM